MSETPTIPAWETSLASVTSLLSAAAGPSGAVQGVAKLLDDALLAFQPLITDDETEKYNNAYKADLAKAVDILSHPLDDTPVGGLNAQRLADFVNGVFIDDGIPVAGGVPGSPLIGVRVEVLLAFINGTLQGIRDKAELTAYASAAQKALSSGTPPAAK